MVGIAMAGGIITWVADRVAYEKRKDEFLKARIELPPVKIEPKPLPPEEPIPPPPAPPSLPSLPPLPPFEKPRKLRWDDVARELVELDAATKAQISSLVGNSKEAAVPHSKPGKETIDQSAPKH